MSGCHSSMSFFMLRATNQALSESFKEIKYSDNPHGPHGVPVHWGRNTYGELADWSRAICETWNLHLEKWTGSQKCMVHEKWYCTSRDDYTKNIFTEISSVMQGFVHQQYHNLKYPHSPKTRDTIFRSLFFNVSSVQSCKQFFAPLILGCGTCWWREIAVFLSPPPVVPFGLASMCLFFWNQVLRELVQNERLMYLCIKPQGRDATAQKWSSTFRNSLIWRNGMSQLLDPQI